MRRRKFLQTTGIATLPILLSGMEVTAISKSSLMDLIGEDNDKILVLVQLNGGNDGLNTFIPLDRFDNLMKVRSDIMIPENVLLKAGTKNAFHHNLQGFSDLYQQGKMSVIQSVSYPNQNRSHFRSTDIWTTASDSNKYVSSGWLGRHFDVNNPNFPTGYPNSKNPDPFAVTIGSVVSETCQGQSTNFSYTFNSPNSLIQIEETVPSSEVDTYYGDELDYLKSSVRQSNDYANKVLSAYNKTANRVTYPTGNFANQLKIVAGLIGGGLSTKIYVVGLGGFDTHASQVNGTDTLTGNHANLMRTLGDGIAAFQKDLVAQGLEKRVMGMTFSEFGRRIRSNVSFGTDHGTAAPVFVFGSCVRGGIVGESPAIGTTVAVDEGVAMQYDFRSIYASLLIDWFKVDKDDVKQVLFKDFQHLPIVEGCQLTDVEVEELVIDASLFPNPASNYATVKFESKGGRVSLALFDLIGSTLKVIVDKKLSSGIQEISIDVSDLPNGAYFLRLAEDSRQKTLKLVVAK